MLALSVGWHDKNKNFTFNTLLIKVSSIEKGAIAIAKGETNSWNTIMSEIHLKNDMLHVLNFKPKQEGFKTFSQKKNILSFSNSCLLFTGGETNNILFENFKLQCIICMTSQSMFFNHDKHFILSNTTTKVCFKFVYRLITAVITLMLSVHD